MSRFLSAFFLLVASACDGASSDPGIEGPIRVHDAQLREGPLPGTRDGSGASGARVSFVEFASTIVRHGQADRSIGGTAAQGVVSIGVGFGGYEGSHWVFPVRTPDAVVAGAYRFSTKVDFSALIPSGTQKLEFVAFDAEGRPGEIFALPICVLPDVPDNGAACDPSAALPDSIVSLRWSTDVDLDLLVVTPDGKIVSFKNPNTALSLEGNVGLTRPQLSDPSNGQLTRDSNAACVIDSIRRESLVFESAPPAGTYRFYARLNRACGELSTSYELEVYRNESGSLERVSRRAGEYLALEAQGAVGLGTLVAEVSFP